MCDVFKYAFFSVLQKRRAHLFELTSFLTMNLLLYNVCFLKREQLCAMYSTVHSVFCGMGIRVIYEQPFYSSHLFTDHLAPYLVPVPHFTQH